MQSNSGNRFERNSKLTAVLLSLLACVMLSGVSYLVFKALRDEVNRGIERYIILREPRPFQDISKSPSKETIDGSQGLIDKKYRLRVDANGFIMPSAIHSEPDYSLVFLGGSTTECEYMEEEERFPFLVGKKLESSLQAKVNSYNTAKAGNNSLHCLFILQSKVIPIHPDVVVLMECINDLTTLLATNSYWTPHYTRGIIGEKEYNPIKMYLMSIIKDHRSLSASEGGEFAVKTSNTNTLSIDEICNNFKKNLELFVFVSRQHDIKPVLMTQFNRMSREYVDRHISSEQRISGKQKFGVDYYQLVEFYARLNNVYRIVANEQRVLLIDLDALVPKTDDYMYDAVHLTAKGSAFVAETISSQLATAKH